jgi:hypothetical protein
VSDESYAEERQFAYSRCFEIVPESLVHVVPGFNDTLGAYVTSYRYEECWLPTLDARGEADPAAHDRNDEIRRYPALRE